MLPTVHPDQPRPDPKMISEGEYFFRGVTRLSWGFATPNYLGAFLAGLLPFTWGLSAVLPQRQRAPEPEVNPRKRRKPPPVAVSPVDRKWWWWAAVTMGLELALWAALGATGSRGAALAALGGVLLWEAYRRYAEERPWGRSIGWSGARLAFCVLGFAVFSFGGRIALGYLAQDASIGNRWLLWGGGVALCHGAPWTGWGVGESGSLFTQWLQPLDRPEEYRTMVNSYLHLTVERGLPALALVLLWVAGMVGWPLVFGRRAPAPRWAGLVRAAACVWAVWAAANIFSTLFDEPRLWVAPALGSLVVFVSVPLAVRGRGAWRWWVRGMLAAGLGGPALVWCAGAFLQWRQPIRVHLADNGAIVLSRKFSSHSIQWGVLPDMSVLGEKYGHELRRWGEADGDPEWSAAIVDARRVAIGTESGIRPERWLVLGAGVEALDCMNGVNDVVVVHPRGRAPRHWKGTGVLLLNQIDEDGSAAAWDRWATRAGLRVYWVPDTGRDARSVWPQSFLPWLKGGAR